MWVHTYSNPGFYQFYCFLDVAGCGKLVIIVFKVYQLCVDECVFDVSVAEELHDVKQVSLMVFHCGFPMTKGVEGYSEQAWVLEYFTWRKTAEQTQKSTKHFSGKNKTSIA